MGLEPAPSTREARIAAITDALAQQFGTDALRVAEAQAREASGEAAFVWLSIAQLLRARSDDFCSKEL
jgi:hypothetical protein